MSLSEPSLSGSPSSLLNIQDVAKLLKVSTKTVYYWVHRSEIPFIKVGKHLRFEPRQVIIFFKEKSIPREKPKTCFSPQYHLSSSLTDWSLKTRADVTHSQRKE